MTSKEKEKEEQTPEEVQPPEPPKETPEPEVQLKTYSKEEHETDKQKALDEQYNKLNAKLSAQGAELKRLRELPIKAPETAGYNRILKEILGEMAKPSDEYGGVNPERANRIAQLQQNLDTEERTTRLEQAQTIGNEYRKRTEDVGLTEEDEEYWEIEDLVHAGSPNALKRADIKLRKLEKAKPQKSEEVEPTDDEKRIQEAARRMLAERGQLEIDTGGTPASSLKEADALAKYVAGEITVAEAKKAGVKLGE